jgi:hypothetical protein
MDSAQIIFVAKIAGAVLAFGLGIWLGIGHPGWKRSSPVREWYSGERLRATWMNRMFFRMDNEPRRFDAGRLIVPKGEGEEGVEEGGEEGGSSERPVVRLRR